MNDRRWLVPFINAGHLLDHLVMLVFPTVLLALTREWQLSYSELAGFATGAFIAFGAFAIPAGWLADHWSRYKMMVVFFFGIGGALFLTGFANSPWQIGLGLTLTGMFAAIYHPVGIAMLVAAPKNLGMALGWNGLWGNLGLAFAAIISGALMDLWGWRAAFFIPGVLSMAVGVAFLLLVPDPGPVAKKSKSIGLHLDARTMAQIFVILLVATACGGVIFNATTFAMPKVFDERLRALVQSNFGVGAVVAFVYTIAAFAQVLMGTLMSRYDIKPLMIGVGLVQVPLLFAASALDGWPLLAVALCMMMAIFGQIPLNDGIVGKYVADEYRARVLSVRYVVSLGVASVAVPMIALLHRTQGGFRNVFLVLGLLACAIFASALFFPSRARIRQAPAAA
jgi:MFS family permease